MLQNSVELVRRVVEGISETAAAPVDLQLLHVAIVFGDGGEREIKAVRIPHVQAVSSLAVGQCQPLHRPTVVAQKQACRP